MWVSNCAAQFSDLFGASLTMQSSEWWYPPLYPWNQCQRTLLELGSDFRPYEIYKTIWQIPLCPIFEKTNEYCFTKAAMLLDIFIWTSTEIRTKEEERAMASQGLECPRIHFMHVVGSFIPHLLPEWLYTGCLGCSVPYGKVCNNWI